MKRWKKITLVSIGMIVVCMAAGYIFRFALGGLLVAVMIGDFDPAKAPPAPDYAQASAWAALPDKDDASDRLPEGIEETPSPSRDLVDVFYIHPTGYMGWDNWNATMGEEAHQGIPTSVMLAGQASAFNGCGRVYAPEYRQASILAFLEYLVAPQNTNGYQALDLAYTDIARAFDYFIEHYNKDRPFILVGHSQGSAHALRLLAEKIDKTPLYPRLIAAYTIGCSMPKDFFTRVYKDVVPCDSPTQNGCLITWDTMREGSEPTSLGFHRYPEGWERLGGKERYCINPLTWTNTEERVPASANAGALRLGMVPFEENPDCCEIRGISHQHTWAQCHKGLLWVANQTEDEFYDRIGFYHVYDFGLFWMNIRENARTRADTYLRAKGQLPSA